MTTTTTIQATETDGEIIRYADGGWDWADPVKRAEAEAEAERCQARAERRALVRSWHSMPIIG